MLKGVQKKFWGTISAEAQSLIAIHRGSAKSCHPLIGGTLQFLPCLEGMVQNVSDPQFSIL